MAISHTFTTDGTTTQEGFSGNCDLSVKGVFGGSIILQVQQAGSTRWDPLKNFSGFNDGNVNLTLIAGDATTLYRFIGRAITGSAEVYLGQS